MGGGDSTRLTRIRTDFWNDVGSERNASESGPFRSVPIRHIVPMESPGTDTSIYFIVLRHYFYWQIEIYVEQKCNYRHHATIKNVFIFYFIVVQ